MTSVCFTPAPKLRFRTYTHEFGCRNIKQIYFDDVWTCNIFQEKKLLIKVSYSLWLKIRICWSCNLKLYRCLEWCLITKPIGLCSFECLNLLILFVSFSSPYTILLKTNQTIKKNVILGNLTVLFVWFHWICDALVTFPCVLKSKYSCKKFSFGVYNDVVLFVVQYRRHLFVKKWLVFFFQMTIQ